jgi:hypothetical protein
MDSHHPVRGHSSVGGIPDNRSESSGMGGTAQPRTPFDAVCTAILFYNRSFDDVLGCRILAASW